MGVGGYRDLELGIDPRVVGQAAFGF